MRKVISLLLAVVLLTMCVGCQPTPEEDYVPQRDGDLIEEKIQAGNSASLEQETEQAAVSYMEYVEAYKASLPQHWSEDLGPFHFDADIIVDNVSSFPVYTITRGKFEVAQLEDMANKFFKNVTGIREGSKPLPEEYAAAVTSLNERGMTKFAQSTYEDMQKAPSGEYTEADHVTLEDGSYQTYMVRLADGSSGEIFFTTMFEGGAYVSFDSHMDAIVHSKAAVSVDGSYEDEGPVEVNPSITEEQGEEMANAFLQELGLEGFSVASVTAARHYDFLYMQEISQGWKFTMMRTYEYPAVNTSDPYEGGGWLTYEEDTGYSKPWRRETVVVYVSENGVEFFSWEYPMEVTGVAAENVELLDFEQVQNNMRKLLQASIDFNADSWRGEITEMKLTVMAQQARNSADTAYLMPVWVVSIDWYCIYNDGTISSQRDAYNLFGINALDGSRAIMRQEDW